MILFLRTDSPTCYVGLQDNGELREFEWEANRELAKGLLVFIEECLRQCDASWGDIGGIVVFRGPGSFTGLRIGMTVVNTVAYAQNIAVVGELGENWRESGEDRLQRGENDKIVAPEYGREARITQPRK